VPRQRQRVGIAVDHELGVEAGRDLDPDAQIVASAEERHFVDARAGLGVGGLRLPRTERLGVEAVLVGGKRPRHGRETQRSGGGEEKAEGAAARIFEHGSALSRWWAADTSKPGRSKGGVKGPTNRKVQGIS